MFALEDIQVGGSDLFVFSAVSDSTSKAMDVIDDFTRGQDKIALTKALDIHPIRRSIQHADLLVVRRGEKVIVEVNIVVEGEAAPGTLVTQDANTIEIEADVQSIPENLTVSVEGVEAGTQLNARDIGLPKGVTLVSDPELLVVNVVVAPTAEELDTEGSGEEGEVSDDEAAEAEASEDAESGSEADSE